MTRMVVVWDEQLSYPAKAGLLGRYCTHRTEGATSAARTSAGGSKGKDWLLERSGTCAHVIAAAVN